MIAIFGSRDNHLKAGLSGRHIVMATRQPRTPVPSEAFEAALAVHRQGRLRAAEALYREVLKAAPDHAGALHHLGVVKAQQGRHNEAIRLIRRALSVAPQSAEMSCDLGVALEAAERHTEAISYYEQALALNPHYPEAVFNLGNALRAMGRHQEAIERFEQALSLRPRYAEGHNNLGHSMHALGRFQEAIACFERALAVRPAWAQAHCNLGVSLKAAGRREEAVSRYREALQIDPSCAEAHSNLGEVLRELGRHQEAVAHCRSAIALRPNYSAAYNNLGNALQALDRHEEAIINYNTTLKLRPDIAEVYCNIGSSLHALDRTAEAVASLEKALSLKRDSADAHYVFGNVLMALGRNELAITHFKKALALKPELSGAYNNMGSLLKELGQLGAARECYFRALELDPKAVRVLLNLADVKKFVPGDPHLETLVALAGDLGALSEEEQMQVHFALGKAYADLGEHGASFRHLLQGNALKRRVIDYDEASIAAFFERIRTVFTPELIARFGGQGEPSRLPIFVLGMPRSGTTLVEQILASHGKVFGTGEIEDFDTIARAARADDGARETPYPDYMYVIGPERLRELGAGYAARLRAYSATAERITNKMPLSFLYVGLIHLALPNARVIHTRRNPIDTCVSCFSKLFTSAQRGLNYSYELGELGRYYRRYDELMAHWRRVLPAGAMLEVPYEALVEDFEPWARRIIDFCGLEWDDACLAFHETKRRVRTASASQVRRPIFKSSIGRWLAYKDLLEPLIKELPVRSEAGSASC